MLHSSPSRDEDYEAVMASDSLLFLSETARESPMGSMFYKHTEGEP